MIIAWLSCDCNVTHMPGSRHAKDSSAGVLAELTLILSLSSPLPLPLHPVLSTPPAHRCMVSFICVGCNPDCPEQICWNSSRQPSPTILTILGTITRKCTCFNTQGQLFTLVVFIDCCLQQLAAACNCHMTAVLS